MRTGSSLTGGRMLWAHFQALVSLETFSCTAAVTWSFQGFTFFNSSIV